MRKDRCVRVFWYFIRQAELYVLTAVAGGVAMAAYLWIIRGGNVQELFHTIPSTVVFVVLIILFTGGTSSAGYYFYSMPISFGCLRKHAFCGNLAMNGLIMAESLLLYWLMGALMHIERTGIVYIIIIALFLIVEGISKFLGIASGKWGKTVYIAMIIGVAVICGFSGFVAGYGGVSGKIGSLMSIDGKNRMQIIQWCILAAGGAISAAANVGSWHMIRKFEVRT